MSTTSMFWVKCLFGLMIGIPIAVFAQRQDSSLHIYILLGQSNMAGRGLITDEYKSMGHARVVMLDSNSRWIPAAHPLHFDKPTVAGVGPGLSFGIAMAEADSTATIGLVPCAVGGTSITKWMPGAFDRATATYPYNDAIIRIMEAMKYGVVKGIIWHQGEADSSPEASALYIDRLVELIDRIRTAVGNPNLPFVGGELGKYREQYENINKRLPELPLKVDHTAVVTSEGLVHKGDTTHFDSPSATEYGKRYAAAMLLLHKSY